MGNNATLLPAFIAAYSCVGADLAVQSLPFSCCTKYLNDLALFFLTTMSITGYTVLSLHRSAFCGVAAAGLRKPGDWAHLTDAELKLLQQRK